MASITALERHPTDPCRLRLTSSVALEGGSAAGADDPTNYSLVGGDAPVQPLWANVVPGTSGTKVDLCFSADVQPSASPLALWRFDEPNNGDTAVDEVSGDFDLTPTNNPVVAFGPVNRARTFDENTARVLSSAHVAGTELQLQGAELSVRAIARVDAGRTTRGTILSYEGSGAGQNRNEQLRISVETDGRITWMWEHGVNVAETGTSDRAVASGRTFYLHLVRTITGSGYSLALYVNGELWQQWNSLSNAPDGGDHSSAVFGVGRIACTASEAFKGTIDSIAVDLGVLASPTEDAQEVMFPFATNATYSLEVEGITDSAGAGLVVSPGVSLSFYPADYSSSSVVPNAATLVAVPQGSALPTQPSGTAGINDGSTLYGVEIGVFPDLGQSFQLVSGPRAIAEALYRRLSCARGTLSFHPNFGLDLRDRLNDSLSQEQLFALKQDIERECERDERVASVNASVSYSSQRFELTAIVEVTPAEGPTFTFTVAVSQLTSELLAGAGG